MRKLKKILLVGCGIFVALIIVTAIIVGVFLNKVVKAGIETIGPTVTQTTVTLESISISPIFGSAGVTGLIIGNPQGYKAPQAINIGKAAVSVAPSSLLANKIIVRSVELRAPQITFEGNPLGANNLTKIMDNVTAATSGNAKPDTNAPVQKGPSKKLQVDDFLIKDAKVHVSVRGKEMTLPLPDIHLTGLGKGPEGITPAELTKVVLTQITGATLKAVTGSIADLGKDVESLGKDAGKNLGGGVNKITKGVGGLFKK